MSRVDLYPTQSASPSAAKIQTGSVVPGDKVAADTVVLNEVDADTYIKGLAQAGRATQVQLVSTQWRALPSTALSGRRVIMIQNQSGNGGTIILNYATTAPVPFGFRILDGGHREIVLSDSIIIYGRMSGAATGVALVEELA